LDAVTAVTEHMALERHWNTRYVDRLHILHITTAQSNLAKGRIADWSPVVAAKNANVFAQS